MPRPSRLVIPGVPLHITQRGVDRGPTFLTDDDFAFYRWALTDAASRSGCAVHAYVFMTNHVHLLVTPTERTGPQQMMASLGRRYVRYFNYRYGRTGTLWEGRFRSALVHSPGYFFSCSRYIELNPVNAAMVASAADYEWSSFHANANGADDPLVTPHPQYLALGDDRAACRDAYRALFAAPLEATTIASIRASLRRPPPLAATRYRQLVDSMFDEAAMRHQAASRGSTIVSVVEERETRNWRASALAEP